MLENTVPSPSARLMGTSIIRRNYCRSTPSCHHPGHPEESRGARAALLPLPGAQVGHYSCRAQRPKPAKGDRRRLCGGKPLLLPQPPGTARPSAPVPHQYRGRLGQLPRKAPSSCQEVYEPDPERLLVKHRKISGGRAALEDLLFIV